MGPVKPKRKLAALESNRTPAARQLRSNTSLPDPPRAEPARVPLSDLPDNAMLSCEQVCVCAHVCLSRLRLRINTSEVTQEVRTQAHQLYGLTLSLLEPLLAAPATMLTLFWANGKPYERGSFLHADIKSLIAQLQPAQHLAMLRSLKR